MNKKFFAVTLGLAMTLSLVTKVMADDTTTTTTDSNYQAKVDAGVIDGNNTDFQNRIRTELVERPAPQVGQSRAAIEALYGPPLTAMAPNKDYVIYTNEVDLVDGKVFKRNLTPTTVRIFQVSYNTEGADKTPNDKAVDIKQRVIPAIGDNENLVEKMLGAPISACYDKGHVIYGIPKERFTFYNGVISSPFKAMNAYYNAQGDLVSQEFMSTGYQGGTVMTSAHRSVEFESKSQPDTKVGW